MKLTNVLAVAALAACCGSALADPLNLVPNNPDVSSGFVLITYDATSHAFSATGSTQNINLPGGGMAPAGLLEFTLTCTISNAGVASNGHLAVHTNFFGPDTLAFGSNNLTAFGFGAFNKFEFVFKQEAGDFAPVGTDIGSIMVGPSFSFPGDIPSFDHNFTNELFEGAPFGDGNVDTFVIPAPSAAGLGAVAMLFASRRRRSR